MEKQTINVLLVEDSATQAHVIRRMLRAYPGATFEVDWMESTEGALGRIAEGSFDLVLLDHNLPGEDGLSFLRRISVCGDLPSIIMLTAGGDERLAAEAMQAGASDYYPKSAINAEILGHAIHKSLQRSQLTDMLVGAEQVIFTLASAVEAKDPSTMGRVQRVAKQAIQLGRKVGLSDHQLEVLRFGSILHDIGKMNISDSILNKGGPLNAAEWEQMRKHPQSGESICATLHHAHEVNPIIRHHHERWDGRGYPDGLSGTEIPVQARIIGAVDAYDAMSSDRPYRAALPMDKIFGELSKGAGTQFDPDIVGTLIGLIEGGEIRAQAWELEAITAPPPLRLEQTTHAGGAI